MVTYITRAQIGLRAPNGSHSLVVAQVKNTAFHYPGTPNPINAVGDAGFRRVCSALRGWQDYHMNTRGWSDIAYCVAVDQVGRAYTLRGINIRSAANGDAQVNLEYGAVLLVLGNNEAPSAAMEATSRAVMQDYRVRFTAIPKRPTWHGAIRPGGTAGHPSTDCPGQHTINEIKAGKFDAGTATPVPPPPPPPDDWEAIMALFNSKADFIEAIAQGTEAGNDRYFARFFKDNSGTGDDILDEVKAQRQLQNTKMDELIAGVHGVAAALQPKANQ